LFGNEFPADFFKQWIQKLGAGVGFLAFAKTDVVFIPAGFQPFINCPDFIGFGKVFRLGKMLLQVVDRKNTPAYESGGLLYTLIFTLFSSHYPLCSIGRQDRVRRIGLCWRPLIP
jgi:hypothetical protein